MSRKQNKLEKFWQELKRRNVTRVLAVYIAAGFMILELVSMMSDSFGLPEWSWKVTFFILLAGLVITLIVSWVYDMTPGGIRKPFHLLNWRKLRMRLPPPHGRTGRSQPMQVLW